MPKRDRRSDAEWQEIIERQEQSGLTGVAFCLQEGIYAKTFYRQRKMLRRKGLVAETKQFIQVQPKSVQTMPNQPAMVLQYRDSRLQISARTEPHWLAQLMKALS
jgi:cytochrome c biogenesis protein ResB